MRKLRETFNALVVQDLTLQLEDELSPFQDNLIFFLSNFDLNGGNLKADQFEALRDFAPRNLQGPSRVCEIYAMTDTSGANNVNLKVGETRLKAVQQALLLMGVPMTKVFTRFAKSIGEEFALTKMNNSVKLPSARAVVMAVSSSPFGIPTRSFQENVLTEIIRFGRKFQPLKK